MKRPTLSDRLDKKKKNEKKEKIGSGEQSIEIPNSERMKSERMKELRKLQREAMEADEESLEDQYETLEETENNDLTNTEGE